MFPELKQTYPPHLGVAVVWTSRRQIVRWRREVRPKDNSQQRVTSMCEYSLHSVASRPAKAGDELLTTKFSHSETRGFSAIGEPNVAVCLLPGTEVAFEEEAQCSHPFARLMPKLRFGKLGEKLARFRQVNIDDPNTHHDALEFANGKIVLLTRLRPRPARHRVATAGTRGPGANKATGRGCDFLICVADAASVKSVVLEV